MEIDSEVRKRNGENFAKFHPKARDILRSADGEKSYKQIATENGIHHTNVSSILNEALNYSFATRVKRGLYKKLPGVMRYIPKSKNKMNKKTTVSQIINKVFNKKIKNKEDPIEYEANFQSKTEKMGTAYKQLFVTENTLRELIRKTLSNEINWWTRRVPGDIKKKVEEKINDIPYDSAKRKDYLEYTDLGQLANIIIKKDNWRSIQPFLKHKLTPQTFNETVTRAIPARNAIGHCIPLTGEDLKFSDMRFSDILKMLK